MPISGDLLLDPVVVRAAADDPAHPLNAGIAAARAAGRTVWIPAGAAGSLGGSAAVRALAGSCQWLAELPGDAAAALGAAHPAGARLAALRERLGAAAVVVSDAADVRAIAAPAVSAAELARDGVAEAPIALIDLVTQQNRVRAALEHRVHHVLRHGHYIMGPEIAELEARLAAYVGVGHCISVASGTDSLEIALRALGVGAGDEVITVPFTWISTAEVIGLCGAKPVFVDIEPVGFNLDPERLEAAITPRTKAIMPVDLFGQMPDYDRINTIAARHGIPVIQDAAQSFGATQRGRRACAQTLIGSTSFFPAKPLGCYGDGGALFTDDEPLALRMRAIRTHGGERRHHHPHLGMNGRLDTLQAAVLLAKLEVWDDEVVARGRIGARYNALLRDACGVPETAAGNTHVYAQYTVRVAGRDAVAERLKAVGIPTAVYYPKCLHQQPVFASLGYRPGHFPIAERAAAEVLSLPMHPYLAPDLQERIAAAMREAIAHG